MRRSLAFLSRIFLVLAIVSVAGYLLFVLYSFFGDVRGFYMRAGDWQMFVVVAVLGFLLITLVNKLLKWGLHAELAPRQFTGRLRRRRY